jgi:hypothetical protein
MIVLTGLSGLLAGCGSGPALALAPLHDMPHYVQSAEARVQQAYQFAVANPEPMKQLPCYCGCGPIGHKNLYDCYVEGVNADGLLAFDQHASNCGICVDITHDAMRMLRQGQSASEMKDWIDKNYSRYGASNMP